MEITQARLQELFDYHQDGYLIWKKKISSLSRAKIGSAAGYWSFDKRTGEVRRKIGVENKYQYAHRLIYIWHFGEIEHFEVDHIDGNTTNDKVANLRKATHHQNGKNLKTYSANTTGYKGVAFDKKAKKYRAYVSVDKKLKHLGFFDLIEDAIKTRKEAEEKFYGKWVRK